MRATFVNLTTRPQRFFPEDKNRGIFILRNKDATQNIMVQFGYPSANTDGFEVLAGDTLTLDRGDLSQDIFLWSDVAHSNNSILLG